MAALQTYIIENEDFARIYIQAAEHPSKLSQEAELRFGYFVGQVFARFDVAVDLYKRGMIDNKAMNPYTRFVSFMFEHPYVAQWWKTGKQFFSDDLRSYVAEHLGYQ
jgi:ligand-binding SRPBCC domain-containing protein